MTPPDRLTVRSPEDILGFIPHSLGYWPSASLVAMTMHGGTLGATLRLDLPEPDTVNAARYARTVLGYLQKDHDADGALLAMFAPELCTASPSPANGGQDLLTGYTGLLRMLEASLGSAGMPVREAWYVGDEYWRDAHCLDPECCPIPGRPVQQIRDSALNAEMVYRGSSVGPAPEREPAPVRPLSSLHRAAVLEAEALWGIDFEFRRRCRAQFESVLDVWQELLRSPQGHPFLPGPDRDGFLRATLLVPHWRDALLVMGAGGRRAATAGAEQSGIFDDDLPPRPVVPPMKEVVKGPPGQGPTAGSRPGWQKAVLPGTLDDSVPGYGEVLMGVEPAVPDWAAMDALDAVLAHLTAPGGTATAAALTMRGWIAWCRGRGSYAAAHLGEALATEPGYRLAELLLDLVRRGAICGWAGRKDSAWPKFGTDMAAGQGGGARR